MRKIAFFVEGQTEMLFLEALLRYLAEEAEVRIENFRAQGGGKHGKPRLVRAWARGPETKSAPSEYYAQIVDCGGDSKVISDIRDNHESLANAGFCWLVGLRDVYPDVERPDVHRLRRALQSILPKGRPHTSVILAVMEVEAWFLDEHSHFNRLDPRLTLNTIQKHIGLDLRQVPASSRNHPAEDLRQIYDLAFISYNKSGRAVRRTLAAMDFRYLCEEQTKDDADLARLVDILKNFLQRD